MKVKKIVDRKKLAYNHCQIRALERYGLILTKTIYREMVRQIKENTSRRIKQISNIRSIHAVKYNSKIFYVIYHKKINGLVTFLPQTIREEPNNTEVCYSFIIN
ncbi:hypothetical protein KAZ01_00080 [Candidatus Gracilibacteria bacterium]|nr:hypothetical protein [Candidatus Gracilibacteria bacterium]